MIVKEIQCSMNYMDRALQLAERYIKYDEKCPETLKHVIRAGRFVNSCSLDDIAARLIAVHCPASLFRGAERCCANMEDQLCKISTCRKCWAGIYQGEKVIW